MKRIICLLLATIMMLYLSACGNESTVLEASVPTTSSKPLESSKPIESSKPSACEHKWKVATCTTPKTCSVCKTTEGVALGHKWSKATCTEPKTCTVCKKTEGIASTHSWKAATCTIPKTCSVCKKTEGTALGHKWKAATYTAPKTCTVCNATEGKVLDNSAEKEKEIKSENWRHEEAVDSIKLNYQATINANEDQISIIRSVIGYTNYTQSQFDSLQQTYSKKAYQLELLKMGNGSAVQIQQLEYEVSSLRTQLAQMHIALQYQQEITNLENSNINLRQRMQTELAAENALHRQKLQAIEDKYS